MPLKSQIHIDKALSNVSVAYANEGFLSDKISPSVPVKHDTDKYFVYSKDNFRIEQTLRANKAEARETSWNVSTGSYILEKHSLKDYVTDDEMENADSPLQLRVDTTENLTHKILVQKENSLLSKLGTGTNWGTSISLTSTYAWSAYTTLSNPIPFVDTIASTILQNTGKKANTMVIDHITFQKVKEHPSIVDRIKYTSSDSVSESLMAKLFNIDRFFVAESVYNAGKEGLTDSMQFIMTDCAWIGYVNPRPSIRTPSALYTMNQRKYGMPFTTKSWREEGRDSEAIEVNTKYQHKIVASDCAGIIINTVQ